MKLTELTTGIVASYVLNNHVSQSDLPALIATVHGALARVGNRSAPEPTTPDLPTKLQIRHSVTPSGLVSFINGKTYKMLKRHLSTNGMTPSEYRERFGLSPDYPLVATEYRALRSAHAISIGLGQANKKASAEKATSAAKSAPSPKPKAATKAIPSRKPKAKVAV